MISERTMVAPGVALVGGRLRPGDYEAYRRAYREAVSVMLAERTLPGSPTTAVGGADAAQALLAELAA